MSKFVFVLLFLGLLNAQNLVSDMIVAPEEQLEDLPHLPVYVGKGYNLLDGNPMSDQVDPGFGHGIFDFTYNKKEQTDDGKFLIPDDVSHRLIYSCAFSSEARTFRGGRSYHEELKSKASVEGGYKGLIFQASFTASTSYEHMQNSTINSNMSYTHSTAECDCYGISVNIFKTPKLSANFIQGVKSCAKSHDWNNFIHQFGTHFATDTIMGGRATQEISYSFESMTKLNALNIDINVAAKASFAKYYADASFDWQKHKEQISYSEKFSSSQKEIYIGGQPPKDGNIHTWASNVRSQPMPTRYSLLDLGQLFQHIPKDSSFDPIKARESFNKGLDSYCQSRKCKSPISDRGNPPKATVETARAGPYGGPGGNAWLSAYNSITLDAVGFEVSSSGLINKFQMILGDGIDKTFLQAHGGTGGKGAVWNVPNNEHIAHVEFYYDKYVNSLTFITNKGNKSPVYGLKVGKTAMLNVPTGYRIIGDFGRSGDYVDQLGFIVGKTVVPKGYASDEEWAEPQYEDVQKLELTMQ